LVADLVRLGFDSPDQHQMNRHSTLLAHDKQGRRRIMGDGMTGLDCAPCHRYHDFDDTSPTGVRRRLNSPLSHRLEWRCAPCARKVGINTTTR
jgi:hypothetical protein